MATSYSLCLLSPPHCLSRDPLPDTHYSKACLPILLPSHKLQLFIDQSGIKLGSKVDTTKVSVHENSLSGRLPDLGVQNLAFVYTAPDQPPTCLSFESILLDHSMGIYFSNTV